MRQLILSAVVAFGVAFANVAHAADPVQLTLVSYAVAKPVYAKIIPAFIKQYKADTGRDVKFKESYGPSGAQTRAIVSGLEADILATNLQAYIDPLVNAGLVKSDWNTRLPYGGSPVSSVIVAVVRKNNPKNIKTWTDIAADGVQVVAINPKTSGNARWGVLAGYASILKTADQAAADGYVQGLVRNTKTLVGGGREATDAFVKNRIGDVLLTFENEAKFAGKVGGQDLPYVAPETNVRVDFPVCVIDKNVDKHGTREAAEAFAKFLFSDAAQTLYAEAGYRPNEPKTAEKFAGEFSKTTRMITVDELGGWPAIDKALFNDGALYDQAQAKK